MAFPFTDNFTRADAANLGANWSDVSGESGWSISGNKAIGTPSAPNTSYVSGQGALGDDQYAQITIGVLTNTGVDDGVGPVVRRSLFTMYFGQATSTECRLYKRNAGYTKLGTDGAAASAGDVMKLQVVGTTLTLTRNGTPICGTPVTDPDLTAGEAGMWTSVIGPTVTSFTADVATGGGGAAIGAGSTRGRFDLRGPFAAPLSFERRASGMLAPRRRFFLPSRFPVFSLGAAND